MGTNSLAVVGHVGPGFSGRTMAAPHALAALAALGQPTRLAIFRLLVRKEPAGLSAGALAEAVGPWLPDGRREGFDLARLQRIAQSHTRQAQPHSTSILPVHAC